MCTRERCSSHHAEPLRLGECANHFLNRAKSGGLCRCTSRCGWSCSSRVWQFTFLMSSCRLRGHCLRLLRCWRGLLVVWFKGLELDGDHLVREQAPVMFAKCVFLAQRLAIHLEALNEIDAPLREWVMARQQMRRRSTALPIPVTALCCASSLSVGFRCVGN